LSIKRCKKAKEGYISNKIEGNKKYSYRIMGTA
jgi:hypothetical protein